MGVRISEVKKIDPSLLEELEDFERKAFGEAGLDKWTLPVMIKYGRVFTLKEDNRVVGLAEFIRDWSDSKIAYVVGFSIEEESRGKGYGKTFLSKVLDKMNQEGVAKIILTVSPKNRKALALYNGFGFEQVDLVRDMYGTFEDRAVLELDMRRWNR